MSFLQIFKLNKWQSMNLRQQYSIQYEKLVVKEMTGFDGVDRVGALVGLIGYYCTLFLNKCQFITNKYKATIKMDPDDFKGVFKWKFLIPGLYIVSWILMIVGPIFFPKGYQIYCIIIIVYSLLKTMGLTFGALVAVIMQYRTLKNLAKIKQQQGAISIENRIVNSQGMLFHAIVIPSYKQEEEVLLETLDVLAKSPRAKTQFIIYLAMEAHQKGSDQKAKALIEKRKQNFFYMGFSQHQVRNGEAKGKASNVSWCVEHISQNLPRNLMIDLNLVMLTIIDADSWAPVEYFEQVQLQLKKRPQIRDMCMFSVPQIYTRNHLDVPIFNRIYDQMHSLVHLANLVAIKYSFPLSNYTISYNCAQKMGWWDTCADAIGEDFHTCQKCYWKFQKQPFITVPIYLPFNQFSLSTGEGYIADIKARFWQAERHTLGVTDVAYCWHMLFKTRFMFRNLILTFLVTEVFAMAAVIPWALLALGIQYKLVTNPAIHYFDMWVIDLLLNATPIFTVSSYVFYEWWKRVANKEVWKRENDKWWRVLEYPILFMVALFGFSVPAFLMASFAVLCTKTQYKVAEKRVNKNPEHVPTELKPLQKIQSLPEQEIIATSSASQQQPQKRQKNYQKPTQPFPSSQNLKQQQPESLQSANQLKPQKF